MFSRMRECDQSSSAHTSAVQGVPHRMESLEW